MSAAFGGGASHSQSQQQSTDVSHRGLDPTQSADLSKYVGPGLMDLYNFATAKLGLGSSTPSTSKWIVPPGGTASGYSGQVPQGYQLMPGQSAMSGNYILNPSAQTPAQGLTNDSGTQMPAAHTTFDGAGNLIQAPSSGSGKPQYYNATTGQITDMPSELQTTPGTTTPSGQQPFQLPGLDQNGLYAGQTGAVQSLLSKAYGNLGVGGDAAAGSAGIIQSILPQLMNTTGNQTLAGTMIPEQVRQQRVANVNSVLQLMSAGLGGSSAGQGSHSGSDWGFQFQAKASSNPMNSSDTSGGQQAQASSFCWIAIELYGVDSPKVALIRWWLLTAWPVSVVNLYRRYGQQMVRLMRRSRLVRALMRLIFDGLVQGATRAHG